MQLHSLPVAPHNPSSISLRIEANFLVTLPRDYAPNFPPAGSARLNRTPPARLTQELPAPDNSTGSKSSHKRCLAGLPSYWPRTHGYGPNQVTRARYRR